MPDRIIPLDAEGRPLFVKVTGPDGVEPEVVRGRTYRVVQWWDGFGPIIRNERGKEWALARPDGSDASAAVPAWEPAPDPADPRLVNSDGEDMGPRLVKMLRDIDPYDYPSYDERCRIGAVLEQAIQYIEACVERAEGGDRG